MVIIFGFEQKLIHFKSVIFIHLSYRDNNIGSQFYYRSSKLMTYMKNVVSLPSVRTFSSE